MIEINPSEFKIPPLGPHQVIGIKHIVKRDTAALLDEMGVGKTYQVVNAACILARAGEIDTVIVVAPASVRGVWDNPETGEIHKFSWIPYSYHRFDGNKPRIFYPLDNTKLMWITTSYDFLRVRLDIFINQIKGRNILLVLDESSYVKSTNAQRTKACKELRKYAKRCVILNGTPVANNLMDFQPQFDILDPESIFGWNYWKFRGKIAIRGGWENKQIIGYKGLTFNKETGLHTIEPNSPVDNLLKHMQPWVLRREKKDVLSYLPEKTYQILEIEMSTQGWKLYSQMRDMMVAWLEKETSTAVNGAVKAMRLSQITSGFLGGFTDDEGSVDMQELKDLEEAIYGEKSDPDTVLAKLADFSKAKEIDDSKMKAFFEFLNTGVRLPVVAWCRFRAELERFVEVAREKGYRVGYIYGGQNDRERQAYINGFQNGDLDLMFGQPRAGGLGLTLTAASTVCYLSNDFSLIARSQSEDRVHRPGQKNPVLYVDFVSIGPRGQKTIDHLTLKALKEKKDMLHWSTKDWKEASKELL